MKNIQHIEKVENIFIFLLGTKNIFHLRECKKVLPLPYPYLAYLAHKPLSVMRVLNMDNGDIVGYTQNCWLL